MAKRKKLPDTCSHASGPHQEHLATVPRPTLAEGASRAGPENLGIASAPGNMMPIQIPLGCTPTPCLCSPMAAAHHLLPPLSCSVEQEQNASPRLAVRLEVNGWSRVFQITGCNPLKDMKAT